MAGWSGFVLDEARRLGAEVPDGVARAHWCGRTGATGSPNGRRQPTVTAPDSAGADQADRPDLDTLQEWMSEGGCEATDGCWVEPDGTCEHGEVSWLVRLGYI
jgi:hypothetical protein